MDYTNKYIDIDSRYRNRVSFPNPAVFEVECSVQPQINKKFSLDPVCDSAPTIAFNNSVNAATPSFTLNITGIVMNGNSNPYNLVLTTGLGQLSQTYNFYRGSSITLGGNTHNVKEYMFLDESDKGMFRLETPLDQTLLVSGTTGTINSPTDTMLSSGGRLFIPNTIPIHNFYANYYADNITLGESKKIVKFDKLSGIATLESKTDSPWVAGNDIAIRKSMNYTDKNTLSNSTLSSIELDATIMNVGDFIRVADSSLDSYNETHRIDEYDSDTGLVKVSPPLSIILPAGTAVEVLPFTKENYNSMKFNYSHVTRQSAKCSEVELMNIILPNDILESGGRVAQYPYVYVELTPNNTTSHNEIMISNNHNSNRKLFKVPVSISDIVESDEVPYIKLDCIDIVHTIKFKLNTTLKFGVYLPGGSPFKTDKDDTMSPLRPNPLLQISATFRVREVSKCDQK